MSAKCQPLLRASAHVHHLRPVLDRFPLCLTADQLLSLPQQGGDWLQDMSLTTTFLPFAITGDGWLAESCIYNLKPHMRMPTSPVPYFTYHLSSHITLLKYMR